MKKNKNHSTPVKFLRQNFTFAGMQDETYDCDQIYDSNSDEGDDADMAFEEGRFNTRDSSKSNSVK